MSVGEKKKPYNNSRIYFFSTQQQSSSPHLSASTRGSLSQKSRYLFGPGKLFYVFHVHIQDKHFNRFENDQIKLLANETKLTGL